MWTLLQLGFACARVFLYVYLTSMKQHGFSCYDYESTWEKHEAMAGVPIPVFLVRGLSDSFWVSRKHNRMEPNQVSFRLVARPRFQTGSDVDQTAVFRTWSSQQNVFGQLSDFWCGFQKKIDWGRPTNINRWRNRRRFRSTRARTRFSVPQPGFGSRFRNHILNLIFLHGIAIQFRKGRICCKEDARSTPCKVCLYVHVFLDICRWLAGGNVIHKSCHPCLTGVGDIRKNNWISSL